MIAYGVLHGRSLGRNRLAIEFSNFGKVQRECTNCVAIDDVVHLLRTHPDFDTSRVTADWSRKFDCHKSETIGNVEKTDLRMGLGGVLTTS